MLMPEKKPGPFKTLLAKAGTVDERLGNQQRERETKTILYFHGTGQQQKDENDGK
jgi:hypothetical protein